MRATRDQDTENHEAPFMHQLHRTAHGAAFPAVETLGNRQSKQPLRLFHNRSKTGRLQPEDGEEQTHWMVGGRHMTTTVVKVQNCQETH